MLQLLRRKAQSPYLQGTVLVIILVFIFWGVGSNQQNTPKSTVAEVNGTAISLQSYQQAYDQKLSQFRDQLGGNIPPQLLASLNLKTVVLNDLIQRTLLQQGANAMGLLVSDAEVRDKIQTMSAFQNNGAFDPTWYQEVLTNSRMSVSRFEASLRTDLLSAKIVDALSRFGQVAPRDLSDHFSFDLDEIQLQYLSFAPEAYLDKVEVTPELLAAYFGEHQQEYKTPRQIKIKYLSFPYDANSVAPSDAEIESYYNQNLSQFSQAESRQARHILIKSKANEAPDARAAKKQKLEALIASIRSGQDFAEAAKKNSEDSSAAKGGDLGFFTRGQMVKPFEDAAFSLAEGGMSEVVETQFGFHVLKLEKVKAAHTLPLAEVKEQIAKLLQHDKGKAAAVKQANEAYEKIILAGSLDKYGATLAKGTVPAVTETEFFGQDNPPAELRANPTLVNQAFSLKQGELSSIIEGPQSSAIVFIQDNKAPEEQKLAEVKTEVEKNYRSSKATQLAREAAQGVLDKLQKGASLSDEAKSMGLPLTDTVFVSRANNTETGLPKEIVEQNLDLSAAHPVSAKVQESNNTFYIVGFKEKKAAPPELVASKQEEIKARLQQESNSNLLAAWLENLRKKATIKTHEEIL